MRSETIFIIFVGALLCGGILILFPPTLRLRIRLDALRRFPGKSAALSLPARISSGRHKEKIDRELYTALGVLRNYAHTPETARQSADRILEQFAQRDGPLRSAYADCLRLLRTGHEQDVPEAFAAAGAGGLGRDLMVLLLDWDRIAPPRLIETLSAYRTALKEARTTALMRTNEILSDLLYLPVVAGVLVVFMNFVYFAYYVEQRELLSQLFF
ncbi:MAG: hypothetical protein FWF33_05795 [Clostridiales bacterium]|nr:hypothetical protein [Clostridiales bacterium]